MLEEISKLIPECEDSTGNLRRLLQDFEGPFGVIPFVGAGLSVPNGLPGWSEFLIQQARRAGILKAVRHRLGEGGFEEAADLISSELGLRAFYDAIEDAFGDHNFERRPLCGAVRLMPELSDGPVITTNFDHVLQRAFPQFNKPFERVVLGAKVDIAAKALLQNRHMLLKLHGDVDDRTERILTLSDYEKQYGKLDQPLPRVLGQILTARVILFIGCSLTRDRTLSVLGEISSAVSMVTHYAIVERPRSPRKYRLRARSLSQFGIRPIWYPPGRHEFIERVLELLLKHRARVQRSADHSNDGEGAEGMRSELSTARTDGYNAQNLAAIPELTDSREPVTPTTRQRPVRKPPPAETRSITHHFSVGGHEGFVTFSMYEDGNPAEMFIVLSKEGSTLAGLFDSFASAMSLCFQYGVPLGVVVREFAHTRFEPSGWTGNPTVPYAKSIIDYIFRWLGEKYTNTSSPPLWTPPTDRQSLEHDFSIGGHEGRLNLSFFSDGSPCSISVRMHKEGGTVNGILESFSQACTLGLQYGIPAKVLVSEYSHTRFEPSGWTGNPTVPYAKSILDYIFRYTEEKLAPVEGKQASEQQSN